jgi:hypothetical protein
MCPWEITCTALWNLRAHVHIVYFTTGLFIVTRSPKVVEVLEPVKDLEYEQIGPLHIFGEKGWRVYEPVIRDELAKYEDITGREY